VLGLDLDRIGLLESQSLRTLWTIQSVEHEHDMSMRMSKET